MVLVGSHIEHDRDRVGGEGKTPSGSWIDLRKPCRHAEGCRPARAKTFTCGLMFVVPR